MTDIQGQQKPSLSDLAHFGVKGMKWGVRKAPTTEQIKGARRRLDKDLVDLGEQRQQIKSAKKSGDVQRVAREKKKFADMHKSFLKNPDRPTAMRMTRGEQAALLAIGTVMAPGAGTVTAAVRIGAQTTASRIVEKRQKAGYYDNK